MLLEGLSPKKGIITKWDVGPKKSETSITLKDFKHLMDPCLIQLKKHRLFSMNQLRICAKMWPRRKRRLCMNTLVYLRDCQLRKNYRVRLQKSMRYSGSTSRWIQYSLSRSIPDNRIILSMFTRIHLRPRFGRQLQRKVSELRNVSHDFDESTLNGKWSTYSSSESSSTLQNEFSSYLGDQHYSLQHQDCDSISSEAYHLLRNTISCSIMFVLSYHIVLLRVL